MNPVDQARQIAFQQTLLSARRTMVLSEILKLAIDSFRASKLRFALTALGMVIGTASVILVVTIGLRSEERRVGKEGRTRHTRCLSDWSSDVCSSDLSTAFAPASCALPSPRSAW